jgi:hypothetical protein
MSISEKGRWPNLLDKILMMLGALLLLALMTCQGCWKTPAVASLPDPAPIVQNDVTWIIVDGNYCVDPGDYETIALNRADVLRWIKEAKWQLDVCKE